MKPFNLERAIAGDPVITRSGIYVTELHYFNTAEHNDYRLVSVINNTMQFHTKDGKYHKDSTEDGYDLFMAPMQKQEWCNIYLRGHSSNGYSIGVTVYPTYEDAQLEGRNEKNYVTSVKIREWEE